MTTTIDQITSNGHAIVVKDSRIVSCEHRNPACIDCTMEFAADTKKGQRSPSREERKERERQAVKSAPRSTPAAAPTQARNQRERRQLGLTAPRATARQISYIKSLIAREGTDDLSVKLPADLTTLTTREASAAIAALRGEG